MTRKLLTYMSIGLLSVWALGLRLYKPGAVPTSLNRDEAALGYNAFSIQQSGIDEWGIQTPIMFKSFGDYKLPGYVYLDALFIRFLGISDFTVRLPSMLAGFGIMIITYVFALRFVNRKQSALLISLILSLQPWSLFYARMAYEAHLGLFFTLLTIWFFTHDRFRSTVGGLLAIAAAVFTYNSPLILLPILAFCVLWFMRTSLKTNIIRFTGLLIVGMVSMLTLLPLMTQKQNITVFSDPTIQATQAEAYMKSQTVYQKMWNHRFTYYARVMGWNVVQSVSPSFLTIKGGHNPWHNAPNTGHIMWLIYFFGAYGGYQIWRQRRKIPLGNLFLFLLMTSLLPAISTVDAPHATRSLLFLYLISFAGAYGLITIKHHYVKTLLMVWLLAESIIWSNRYFILFPAQMSAAWPRNLKETLMEIRSTDTPPPMTISDSQKLDLTYEQIYIFPLLYYQVDPLRYQLTRVELEKDAAGLSRIGGFEGISISGYNKAVPLDSIMIERQSDGIYGPK